MPSTPLDRAMEQVTAAAAAVTTAPAAPPPAPPSAPPAPPAPVPGRLEAALAYDGNNRELLRLWLKTMGLTILTLGFYRFWGRTRVRRYLWSRLSLVDDRFEYDGTGMELFVRFILVVLVVLLPLAAINTAIQFSGWPPAAIISVRYLVFAAILFLSYIGHYTGQRYRLSRTLWRGIRGGLDGSAWSYGLRGMGFTVLQAFTLSLAKPWQYVVLWRYEARHTRLGSRTLSFEGRGRDLFRAWLVAVVLGILSVFGVMVVFATFAVMMMAATAVVSKLVGLSWKGSMAPLIAGGVVTYICFIVLFWLVWTAITARFERNWLVYSAAGTSLGDLRFAVDADTRAVRRLRIGNFLLTALTLNLAWPFVAQRTLRFYAKTVRVDTDGIERLSQSEGPSRPPASGIAELFDTTGFA